MKVQDSAHIAQIDYDEHNQVLTVAFLNGSVYAYQPVPSVVAGEIARAESKGKSLHRYVIGNPNIKATKL
jgi:hypothetical protein